MATTEYGVNHPLAVKLWAKKLMHEALKETYVSRFMGTSSNSLIYVKDDLNKSAGDRIRVGLRMQLTGAGTTGDATLEGNEEALTTYSDNIFIDQMRHAVRSSGEMSEQRVPFSVREEAMQGLADWFADRLDLSFFNQIAGNTDTTTLQESGMQATIAPSSAAANTRIIYGDGTHTTENSLSTSSCFFELVHIDRAVALAKTASPLIRPIRVNGQDRYVVFMHPYHLYRLRTTVATASLASRVTWYDVMRARVQGGELENNPIFTGAVGEYNGCILHESTRVPIATGTTGVRRSVLCGAQAACYATGQRDTGTKMKWVEEAFDYGNQMGVSSALIWGLKKTQFNSIDFGTIVIAADARAP